MTDATTARQLTPIGRSGVVQYGGRLTYDDRERAWKGEQRKRTIQDMQNDPELGAILHSIEMMIRGVDWTVEPASGDGIAEEQAKEIADFVEQCLEDMDGLWPGDTLSASLSYIPWGYVVQEIVYKVRGGPDTNDKAKRSKYDDGRIGWRSWQTRPQATCDGWEFDEYGDATAMKQRDPQTSQVIDIPLERCIHITYSSKTNSPEGWTPLRPAWDAWYLKRNLQTVEAIGAERDLAGLPLMYYPPEWKEGSPEKQAIDRIVTTVRTDEQAGISLPSIFDQDGNRTLDFKLVSTGGQRAIDTDKLIRRYANEIVAVFLANVMRAGQDGVGTYALSETQSGLFQQAIAAHLDIIGDAINTQAIPALMRVNGIDPELAPKIKHGRIDSVNLQVVGQYLVSLKNAGLLLDSPALIEFVHELAGLPVENLPTQDEIDAESDQELPAPVPEPPALPTGEPA